MCRYLDRDVYACTYVHIYVDIQIDTGRWGREERYILPTLFLWRTQTNIDRNAPIPVSLHRPA